MTNMKKSNLYTKTGDKGMTSLVGGKRVSKTDNRLEAYGTIDELNSFIGLLITELTDSEDLDFLHKIQNLLFVVGTNLATDTKEMTLPEQYKINEENVSQIENEIDRIDSTLPKLKSFTLPGGCRSAALAHVCRTVCRRAERRICTLTEEVTMDGALMICINRLSDYFYALARKECIKNTNKEIFWE